MYWQSPLNWPWTQHIINVEAEKDPTDKHSYYHPSSVTQYTATGLKGSENYRVTVQAVNAYTGENLAGEPSSPASGTTSKLP